MIEQFNAEFKTLAIHKDLVVFMNKIREAGYWFYNKRNNEIVFLSESLPIVFREYKKGGSRHKNNLIPREKCKFYAHWQTDWSPSPYENTTLISKLSRYMEVRKMRPGDKRYV